MSINRDPHQHFQSPHSIPVYGCAKLFNQSKETVLKDLFFNNRTSSWRPKLGHEAKKVQVQPAAKSLKIFYGLQKLMSKGGGEQGTHGSQIN